MKLLYQSIREGGIAYPSLRKYYQVSRMAAMMLQWDQKEKETWEFEQHGIKKPLKEWIWGNGAL